MATIHIQVVSEGIMGRTKGSKNKQLASHPDFLDMSVEERLEFIVNLIVDQIFSEESKEAYYGK